MKKLERRLGIGSVIAIGIGAALGSGVFVLPSLAILHTGTSAWLAYLVAAICILPAALSKAELATAMPTSGGTYVYIERTFGPLAGTVAGLGLFLTLLLKCAFALVGFGAYLSVLTNFQLLPMALGLLVAIITLNILGVSKASGFLIFVVTLSVTSLLGLAVVSQIHLAPVEGLQTRIDDFPEFFYTVSLIFVAFAGVTKLAAIAEEIKTPEKNLPRGILYSVLIVTVIYSAITYVLAAHFPKETFVGNLRPIHLLASETGGEVLGYIFAVIAILTMTSMANAGILAASRFPFAMARDQLAPKILGRLHSRYLTPVWSILLSGTIVAICLATLNVESIAKMASAFMFLIFAIVNVSVIILRETRVQWYKPAYRSPFYPWVQIFGLLSSLFIFFVMGVTVLSAIVFISVPGLILFLAFGRSRTDRRGVIGFRGRRPDLVNETELPGRPRSVELIDLTQDASVVVSLFGKERSPEILFETGVALADGGKVEVAYLTEVPEQTDLDDIQEDSPVIRSISRRISAMSQKQQVQMSFDPVVSHDIFESINDISRRLHCRWLVTEWVGKTTGAFTIHNPMGWLKNHLSCNLAMVRDNGVRYVRKMLVVLKANSGDRFIIDTAEHLAKVHNAELSFMRFVSTETSMEEKDREFRYLENICKYCASEPETLLVEGRSEVNEIIALSVEFDLLLFGTMTEKNILRRTFGSDEDRLMSKAACSVISVQASRQDRHWLKVH